MNFSVLLVAGVVTALFSSPVIAHKPSDSYLAVDVAAATISVQWDIALRDLDLVLGLDNDDDRDLTWGEVRTQRQRITAYAAAALTFTNEDDLCPLESASGLMIDQHSDGAYAVLRYGAQCALPIHRLAITYRLFAGIDPQHRGLLKLTSDAAVTSAVLGGNLPVQTFIIGSAASGAVVWRYLGEGIRHIAIGYDHILFILSLLLPAVAWRTRHGWQMAPQFKTVALDVFKVVTAFTLAHSVTLSAAVLGWVVLPSRWVESAIAASVVLAAAANLGGLWHRRRWLIALLFGLVHGFGFAAVLADLGLPGSALAVALLGFNMGVEFGQLALVALFLPLAFLLRRTRFYRYGAYYLGSAVIALVALGWFLERALLMELPW